MPTMNDDKLYEVSIQDGYILARLWGDADTEVFEASTAEVMTLREAQKVNLLLCDIRELKADKVDIADQTRGIGTLWQIRNFDKVALLLGDSKVTSMLLSALSATHLTHKFKSFESQAEAAVWLKAAS
jgi:hypothetical protein